jgi:hypothetical protein
MLTTGPILHCWCYYWREKSGNEEKGEFVSMGTFILMKIILKLTLKTMTDITALYVNYVLK